MISDEKKKQIESLSTEEMSYEINLGVRSRFQREKFAYLQTCYKNRIDENEEKDAMTRAYHGVPLQSEIELMSGIELAEFQSKLALDSPGKIIAEHEWKRRHSTEIPHVTPDPPANKAEDKKPPDGISLRHFAFGVAVILFAATCFWVINHYLSVNLQNIK